MPTDTPKPADFRFRIEAFSPTTMPMGRLAQYMGELAVLLGEEKAVHFRRVEPGSTVIRCAVDTEAVPKVRARVDAVRRQRAPTEAQRAYRTMNRLLREDNGRAALREVGGTIIQFPGRDEVEERYPPVREHGSIDGLVVSVGGSDNTVHFKLLTEAGTLTGIYATDRQIGKELAHLFDEPVRLNGWGDWNRDDDGRWTLTRFKVDNFEPLKSARLSEALQEIRGLTFQFPEGAYDELEAIRHGVPQANGRH